MPRRAITLLIFSIFIQPIVADKVIDVGASRSVKTIRQAISQANNGDTLRVDSGIYLEGTIVIDKSIVLLGNNFPIIDGEGKYEVISIKADSVIVQGFKIVNSGHASLSDPCAVKVYDAKGVIIKNNILDNNFFGIYIQNGTDCVVRDNQIKAYATKEHLIGNGIHCWRSSNLIISGNDVIGHRDGIYFEFVYNSLVESNNSIGNRRYGLHFMFSHNDRYINNIFKRNAAGVAVMYSKNVEMINNHFDESRGDAAYGLLLKEISYSYIFSNSFSENTTAVFMEGASNCTIEANIFRENGWGLRIQANCIDNTLFNNSFIGNTFDAATNGSLVLNNLDGNYWDKYVGYDLDRDGFGDVPYRPLSLFSVLAERIPAIMFLYRSFLVALLDISEKVLPTITPDSFQDNNPLMKPIPK